MPSTNEIAIAVAVVLILAAVYVVSQKSDVAAAPKMAVVPVLHATEWRPFKLVKKTQITHNTARYRFALPNETDSLGLPIGQHISIQATIDGKNVMRSYTPTSLDDDKGYFELVVKSYEKGNISKYLAGLNIGDTIQVRGPKGKFMYAQDLSPHLLMIAGGTGITPMFQIIKSSLKHATDQTELRLIYANVDESDILIREELEELAQNSNGRLKIYYVLNNPPAGWTGGQGFVTKDMIQTHMPEKGISSGGKVLLCGPPPMMTAMKAHLAELGYPAPRAVSKLEDQVFLF